MLTFFLCPNGNKIPVKECLEKCPRTEGRCLSLPTLMELGKVRDWHGKASTTQLLNPTRIEVLKITKPYAIDPFDQAFALLGTRHHQRLDAIAKQIAELESEKNLNGDVTGTLDLLEPIDGGFRLIDYKTYGSYAAAKHLNLKDKADHDKLVLALQLNNYRLMAEGLGFHVTELMVQITVRDGNTRSAKENGVFKNIYMLPVEILPDDDVREFFLSKDYALQTCLKNGTIGELCNYEERWGGRRCKSFCPVFSWCPEGCKINRVELEG